MQVKKNTLKFLNVVQDDGKNWGNREYHKPGTKEF